MKRIYQRIRIEVLALAGAVILKLLGSTLKWVRNDGLSERVWEGRKPIIFAFWHGRQLLMPALYNTAKARFKRKGVVTLISEHSDGRIIARATEYMGLHSVAGSSTRGGAKAALELIRKVKEGFDIAITPDGPRGPRYEMKKGVLRLSKDTGARLFPATLSFERYWQFRSWDQMILPKPFSKAVCLIGEPIIVPANITEEELSELKTTFEGRLNQILKEADGYEYK